MLLGGWTEGRLGQHSAHVKEVARDFSERKETVGLNTTSIKLLGTYEIY